jgi:hypothetical protein
MCDSDAAPMPRDVLLHRPSVRLTGPLLMGCPCGGTMAVADAAEPLVCPVCNQRWQVRLDLTEVTPRPTAPEPLLPDPAPA